MFTTRLQNSIILMTNLTGAARHAGQLEVYAASGWTKKIEHHGKNSVPGRPQTARNIYIEIIRPAPTAGK
ncbi:MAG: hypothetical protein KDK39_06615 [Leptospiraceae bacterium]|nr:hypothetical protein [Leptospiraceae bacterium]